MLPNRLEVYDEGTAFNANVRSSLNLGLWAIERQVPIVYVSGAIVYKDQTGNLTIGYGHLIKPSERFIHKKKYSKEVLNKLFHKHCVSVYDLF